MPGRLLVLAFLICIADSSQCQDFIEASRSRVDSLKSQLTVSDIHRQVDILNKLASIYAPVNFDSSITYSVQAQRIGSVYGYPAGVGIARLYTGNAYYYKMDLKNALLSYLASLKILEEFKPMKELGELYMQLGNINYYMGRTDKAVSFFRMAGDNFRTTGYYRESLQEPYAISFTYLMHNQLDSALFYIDIYVNECRKLNDRRLEANGLNVMGWIYSAMKDPVSREKSDEVLYKSLGIGRDLNDANIIAIDYLSLGNNLDKCDFYFEGATVNFPLAIEYYNEALKSAKKANLYLLLGALSNYIAAIDIEELRFDRAMVNLHLSENYLDTLFNYPVRHISTGPYPLFGKMVDYILAQQHRILLYDLKFRLAKTEGETGKAIDYLRLYYQYGDSLYSERQARQFELLMAEADAEKTDQKIRSLAQENELNQLKLSQSRYIFIGIGTGVIVISMFTLLFFLRKRLKAEQKTVLMEQRLLRAQMNPHFLFNSLASIQNYIINEDTDKASIYLSKFSQLVRNILDNSVEEYVALEKEIETIENYLELQKVRYAGKFDYAIDIDTAIDTENVRIPPMLAQPFIENAIEHGIKHKLTPGHIDIRFRLENGLIRFEVEDDGVGRDKAAEIEKKQGARHRSMATSITTDRLKAINKKQKKKIWLEIEDLKDDDGRGRGTRVAFGIPVSRLKDQAIIFFLLILVLLLPSCREDISPGPLKFKAVEGNPVLSRGDPGSWDELMVILPFAVEENDVIYLFYTGMNKNGVAAIGLATSHDGYHFDKFPGNPLLSPDGQGFDAYGISSPIVMKSDSGWVMYYNGMELARYGPGNSVGIATSGSLTGPWLKHVTPVLSSGRVGEWDEGFIIPSSVFSLDKKTKAMIYSGGKDFFQLDKIYMGLATSSDGMTWKKYNDPATLSHPFIDSDPILTTGHSGDWDAQCVWLAFVLLSPKGFEMYYSGGDFIRNKPGDIQESSIGYASSKDGIHWEKFPANPVFSIGDDTYASGFKGKEVIVECPSIVFFNGQYLLYYYYGTVVGEIGIATAQ